MPRHPPYTLSNLTTFALDTHGLFFGLFNCQRTREALHLRLPKTGGAERARTADPLLAKQVLSQLSYSPIFGIRNFQNGGHISENFPSDGGPR